MDDVEHAELRRHDLRDDESELGDVGRRDVDRVRGRARNLDAPAESGHLPGRRVALEGRDENEAAVREIMSAPLVVVARETTVDECMSLMTERRIRHLPVADGNDVVGLVSIGDLVKFTSKQQRVEIQYLTSYITTG